MQVIQEFSIKHQGFIYYVRFARLPNMNGIIDNLKRRYLNDRENEMMNDEFDGIPEIVVIEYVQPDLKKLIYKRAAELWDQYWTVEKVRSASEWIE